VRGGAEKAARDLNVDTTFEGPDSDRPVDKQLEMLQKALDKKPAAICLAAVDSQAEIPILQKARDAHIPVIGLDSGVDNDIPVTTAATDNVAAAAAAADHLAQLIGNTGEVAIIAHDQTSRSGFDRVKGFSDELTSKYPNITIVSTDYGAGDVLKSSLIVKAVIQDHPKLKGYFGTNQTSVEGLLDAVRDMKKEGQIVVVGFDSGTAQIDAIRNGVEAGAITQDPIDIGYRCIEAAVKAIQGQTLPKTIDTAWHWYDKTNLDDPSLAPLLYR
jgi:ribose transport system substrate-binding protein